MASDAKLKHHNWEAEESPLTKDCCSDRCRCEFACFADSSVESPAPGAKRCIQYSDAVGDMVLH